MADLNEQDRILWQRVKDSVDARLHRDTDEQDMDMASLIGDTPKTETKIRTKTTFEKQSPSTTTKAAASPIKKNESILGTGLAASQSRKLRRGQIKIESMLDLHGLGKEQAYIALKNHLLLAQERGERLVCVITGKGRFAAEGHEGVLRKSLPQWLAEPPLSAIALDHHTARPQHGGAGAFYILLRKKK